jgi:hypothetical protein
MLPADVLIICSGTQFVFRSMKSKSVLFGAIMLTLVTPAAIDAAGRTSSDLAASTDANTPLDRNLLQNASFEQAGSSPIPDWSVNGQLHLERFGTRTWPNAAYSKKYDGGKDYLACSQGQGTIVQTVAWNGWRPRDYNLKGHFTANFGGTVANRIRAQIRYTGGRHTPVSRQRVRTLDIQNSYKKITVTMQVPEWADNIQVTLQMMPKAGTSKCDVVADTLSLTVFRP